MPRPYVKFYHRQAKQYEWRIRDKSIPMREMTIRHLKNAMGICDRSGNTTKRAELVHILKSKGAHLL
jgi:hypothetical protein